MNITTQNPTYARLLEAYRAAYSALQLAETQMDQANGMFPDDPEWAEALGRFMRP